MKSILLIGVGRFGRHIGMELTKLGYQVMTILELMIVTLFLKFRFRKHGLERRLVN